VLRWILLGIIIVVFIVNFSPVGSVALIGILFLLMKVRESEIRHKLSKTATEDEEEKELADLALLHLELTRLHQAEQIDSSQYDRLKLQLLRRSAHLCKRQWRNQDERRKHLESAWSLLEQDTGQTLGPPPWQSASEKIASEEITPDKGAVPQQTPVEFIPISETIPPVAEKTIAAKKSPAKGSPTSLPSTSDVETQAQTPIDKALAAARTTLSKETIPESKRQTPSKEKKHRGKPEKSNALEAFMSGWVKRIYSHRPGRAFLYQIMVPFFLQNIGWFIAGICGVSGSIYLLAATTGFWKAFAVVISLVGYTGILLGGGYLLRRKRPELITSSGILLALGVLLVPLNITACVRLITAAGSNGIFISTAAIVALIVLGGFAVAVRLASGLIDRSLTKEHPRLFMGMTALQFFVPLLNPLLHWLWLAALHLILLAVLAYGLQRFTRHWLRSIFIDKRKIAYYAAGTLIYAALVSFIHLTLGAGMDLPKGYAGPFLMTLSGLLFSVDIQFKHWVRNYALLSRFTFVIYALSVLALLISLTGGTDHLFTLPLFLSLTLGVLLYGAMVWKYLTLAPLYLLLACFSALYGQAILQFFPGYWHFILALPGLYAIMGLHRLAQQRNSTALALVVHRTMLGLIPMLVIWSLLHSPFPAQGIIPMLTPLAATALVLQILGLTPARLLHADSRTSSKGSSKRSSKGSSKRSSKGSSKGYYMLTGLVSLTLAYTPLLMGSWQEQFSSGLIALAYLWTGWGLHGLRKKSLHKKNLYSNEALFNSALLSIAIGIFLVTGAWIAEHGFAIQALIADPVFSLLFIAAGGGLLWLSLGLGVRILFYGAVIIGGTGIALLKLRYIPVSSGRGVLVAVFMLWALLWYLQRQLSLRTAIAEKLTAALLPDPADSPDNAQPAKNPKEDGAVVLLGLFPVYRNRFPSRTQMVIPPLRQFFYLLWMIVLWKILPGIFLPQPGSSWAVLAVLSAITTLLAAGQTKPSPHLQAAGLICLLPLIAILLIKALLVLAPVSALWYPCLIIGCVLLFWRSSLLLRTASCQRFMGILGWQGRYGDLSGSKLSEQTLHWTALTFALFSTGAACWPLITALHDIPFREINAPFAALLITLALVLFFLWQSGQRYALRLYSSLYRYLFISCAALVGCSLYSWLAGLSVETALYVRHAAPMLSLTAAVLALTAYLLNAADDDSLYRRPVLHTAIFLFLWALVCNGLLFWQSLQTGNSEVGLPWFFTALAFSFVVILHSIPDTRRFRFAGSADSAGTALLLTVALSSFFTGYPYLFPYVLTGWSFVLLGTGVSLLPRLNIRFPQCFLSPLVWPVAGLVLVLSTLSCTLFARLLASGGSGLPFWPIVIGATLYLLLMSYTVRWQWLPWLTGLAVTVSGLHLLVAFLPQGQGIFSLPFLTGAAVWLNLTVQIMPAILRTTDRITGRTGSPSVTHRRLDNAFFFWPCLLLCNVLVLFTLVIFGFFINKDILNSATWLPSLYGQPIVLMTLSVLLIFSFFHLFIVSSRFSTKWKSFFAHLVLLTLTNTVLLLKTTAGILQVPLLLVLWAALLQTILALSPALTEEQRTQTSPGKILKETCWHWLPFLYSGALLTLIFSDVSTEIRLLILVLLSGLSIGLVVLDRSKGVSADGIWRWLLLAVPFFSYFWALPESLGLLLAGWPQAIPLWLPPIFLLLALGQIPLLQRSSEISRMLRGIALPLLLTAAFISFFSLLPFSTGEPENIALALTGWAFILWAAGSHVWPRFNMRWPQWAVFPVFSSLLGLILLLGSVGTYSVLNQHLSWLLLAIATLYLLLLQGNAGWQWLAWLSSCCLTLTGALLLLELFPLMPFTSAGNGSVVSKILHLLPGYPSVAYVSGLLIWLNLLLRFPVFLKHRIQQIFQQTLPLFAWPFLLFNCGLLGLALLILYAFLYDTGLVHVPVGVDGRIMALGGALALSCWHAFMLRPRLLTAQLFIMSGQAALLLLFINYISLPLLFSLSVVVLLFLQTMLFTQSNDLHEKLRISARNVLPVNFALALLSLVFMLNLSAGEHLLAFILLGGSGLVFGLSKAQKTARQWQTGGVVLLIITLHIHWKFWLPQTQWAALLPWNALQCAVLGWLAVWIQKVWIQKKWNVSVSTKPDAPLPENRNALWLFSWLAPFLSIIAALEWLGHGLIFLTTIIAPSSVGGIGEKEIQLLGRWDNGAAISAGILLIWLGLQKIKNHNALVYSLSAAILLLAAYTRLLWAGLAPFTLWDTAALMGAGFVVLIIQRAAPTSLPLYRVTLLLPMLALFTVPWQVGSVYAGTTLFAATAVFLLIQRDAHRSLPVYLALLALNIGIYLWIPGLYNKYRLVQIYTVPMAITVLVMLQLHILELKPSVLNAVRLTALAALYAGTALDVFLRPEFYVFSLAFGLSLLGIVLGIALRVRAFLFTGVIFFILNITGQLVNFYPEERLSKAILLMVSGGLIAGGMIWFSIQRETIMRQIRIIRADLAEWE
jgi:hypothetical protein